jgi:glycosyltransferase involved in cell wall biosynthesis
MSFAEVSVIVPCYRCADTIDRAVASVYSQTLRPAEVILVEDCSGDGTLEKLHDVKGRYAEGWIKVIPMQRNSGPGMARNAGWYAAQYPYIAFLDADDAWHPQKIEIQCGWMAEHPEAVLTGHDCVQIAEGDWESLGARFLPEEAKVFPVSRLKMLLSNRLPTRSVMLRRDLQQRFAAGQCHSEDYLLWLEIICSGGAAYKIDLPLAYLFKAPYGEGGLSAQLWSMQKGEVDTYRRVWRSGCVSFSAFLLLIGWSWVRFVRRVVLSWMRA